MESNLKLLHEENHFIHQENLPKYETEKKMSSPIISNIGNIFQVENMQS